MAPPHGHAASGVWLYRIRALTTVHMRHVVLEQMLDTAQHHQSTALAINDKALANVAKGATATGGVRSMPLVLLSATPVLAEYCQPEP
eukprot:CAMPEP_0181215686 /NCGR_PEP_ID=MMETSP1096-20121128/26150_1 /TAXON_ID=156174 ORGANISM="Chrysochromulina ericina, Strain CCMP281" /NCGR_SAMPLE_ID=MMETSP1096 /ASSEMBLY_ACC=CAM_ASM_000453 /LENGTH=87 /DNA_ID=CAMNT_0023307567 /DNA_START=78 /DNA_END=342 /DNA_ORIENTATION=+